MKILIIKFLFLIVVSNAFSQAILEEKYQLLVEPFVEAVKNNDKKKILDLIHYPFQREYPMPHIYNKQEMTERYNQIFDKTLINIIKNSSVETDWHTMGWRGITLNDGLILIDYDGEILGINYQSLKEKKIRDGIITEIKNSLHESLREFEEPRLLCETENNIIRIDLLYRNNYYDDNYRFALWAKGKKQNESPDMVLTNGSIVFTGSGGNHYYVFVHDNYQYILTVDVLSCKNYGNFIIFNGLDKSWYGYERSYEEDIVLYEKIIKMEK